MRHVALTLTALGVLSVFAERASAEGALSYPMAAHVAAKYGVHHPGHNTAVIQQVSHRRYGHSYRRSRSYHGGPVVVHPPVRRHPTVVIPVPGYPPVMYPPAYRYRPPYYRPYYYRPHYGFTYSSPRFSIGIGF